MDDMTYEELHLIVIDYVYRGRSKAEICKSHHITTKVFAKLYRDYRMGERKEAFSNKILDKNLNNLATTAAKGLTIGIDSFTHRIEKITKEEKELEEDGKLLSQSLSAERLRTTMALFEIIKHRDKEEVNKHKTPKTVEVVFGDKPEKAKEVE